MKIYPFLYKILFIFFVLIFISNYVFADDLLPLEENYDVSEVLEEVQSVEVTDNSSEISNINARAYVVLDRASNTVLVGKNENQKKKMASTTKIMTALVVIENANLSDTVEVSKKAASTGGSRLGLHTGDKITVSDLLYGLMLCSGNDAAVALAEYISGSIDEFANLMNSKAAELNLTNTHFVTPHGLDEEEHYTTAYELAILTNYALENETFAKIVGTKNYTVTINGYSKSLSNTNELLGALDGIYGVKTGFTNGANRCLVTACKRGDLDVICIVLGCDTKKDRTRDSVKLINYVFNNFSMVNIYEFINNEFNTWVSETKNSFIINKGVSSNLELYLDEKDFPYTKIAINNQYLENLFVEIDFNNYYEAPLYENTLIGTLTFKINEIDYFYIKIKNSNYINKKSFWDYFLEMGTEMGTLFFSKEMGTL